MVDRQELTLWKQLNQKIYDVAEIIRNAIDVFNECGFAEPRRAIKSMDVTFNIWWKMCDPKYSHLLLTTISDEMLREVM